MIRLFRDKFDNWKASYILFQSNRFCVVVPDYCFKSRLATDSLSTVESRFLEPSIFRTPDSLNCQWSSAIAG